MLSPVHRSVCLSVRHTGGSVKMAEVRVTQFSAYYPSSFASYKFHPEIMILTGSPDRAVKQGSPVWKTSHHRRYWVLSYCGHEFNILGSRNVVGHMTIRLGIGHFLLVVLWNQASISNVFRDFQWRMWGIGRRDLKQSLDKVQGHSFWYQSIPHIWLPICAVNSNFCSRTHR